MIYGIGVDIVSIRRIERMLERWGPLFIQRVYTPGEIAFCQGKSNPGQHFALRWAAKEAMLKALGLGLRRGIKWTDIGWSMIPWAGLLLKFTTRPGVFSLIGKSRRLSLASPTKRIMGSPRWY